MRNVFACLLGGVSLASGIAFSGPAWGQDDLPNDVSVNDRDTASGEIIVTARRRAESAQKTPISVAAIAPETLENADIQEPADLSRVVAGLLTTPTAAFGTGFTAFIRGIGSTESSLAVDQSIGLYRDGVYMGHTSTGGNNPLGAVDRVEVLRGPQGTLFGRNTTGGAINVVTREPREDLRVQQLFRYGRFSELQSSTTIDTGEFGQTGIAAILNYDHRQRNGYTDDPTAKGAFEAGAFNSESVFAKVRGSWGGLSLTYVFDHLSERAVDPAFLLTAVSPTVAEYYSHSPSLGGDPLIVTDKRVSTYDFIDQPRQNSRIWGHSLTAEFEVADALTLKSITAWRRYRADFLPFRVGNDGLVGMTSASPTQPVPVPVYFTDPKRQRNNQFTEEVQALGEIGNLQYTLGLFYLKETASEYNQGNLTFPVSGTLAFPVASLSDYDVRNKSKAAYGQVSYRPAFLPDLELTGGIRFSEDDRHIDQRQSTVRTGDVTFKNTTFALSAAYEWTPDIMTFARVGTGVRSGGFNIRAGAGQEFVFLPEKATSYEIGLKSRFFDRRVLFNAGLFYTKYDDLQVTTITGISQGGGLGGQTYNANADYRGGEVELVISPTNALKITANAGYVDPKYQQIFLAVPGAPADSPPANYADSARFPYLAKFNGNVSVDYSIPVGDSASLRLYADYSYVSKRWFHISDLANQSPLNEEIASPAHGIFNGRITLEDFRLASASAELSFWMNNVFNKFYRISGIDFGSAGFAGNIYNPPRTFGVDLKITLEN